MFSPKMKITDLVLIFLVLYFINCVYSFRVPLQESTKGTDPPYGRRLRAILTGKIPNEPIRSESDDIPENLSWWQSLSRNNTLDCECGTFSESSLADRWNEEGIYSLNVYPWSVSLVAPGGNYAFCGGTLVNDRYVLTSASCVDGSFSDGVEVLIGTWPLAHYPNQTDPDELNPISLIRKKVHRVILHPMYLDNYLDHNIALLRLLGPVPTFGNKGGVSPVCLPSPEAPDLFDGQNATSLLWRFHESFGFILPIKRTEVDSYILSANECKNYEYSEEWKNLPDTIMCSKMEMSTNETYPYKASWDCPGDAGGFLVVTKGHQKVQVGIDSWTACFGRPKGIGLYTNLYQFLPWISLHISKDGRHCAR